MRIKNKMNIVWNGTGKNITKYYNLIEFAKLHNYIIELNGIWVPVELAKTRVRRRSNSYGRDVPENIITTALKNIPPAFKTLRVEADYARIWKNSPSSSPRVLWDKHQGWLEEEDRLKKGKDGWTSPVKFLQPLNRLKNTK